MSRKLFVVLFALWLSLGCRTTPRATFLEEWHSSLQAMGILPLYPPREDFSVGDVFLRDETTRQPLKSWFASLDLTQTLETWTAGRTLTKGGPREASVKTGLGTDVFLGFTAATVRGSDLEWVLPGEALSLVEGHSWRGRQEVTMRIPSAISFALPFNKIAEHLLEPVEGSERIKRSLGIAGSSLLTEGGDVDIEVITTVYYANAIDLAISRARSGFGSSGPFEPVGEENRALVAKLNERLQEIEGTTPGASIAVIGANDASLVLRRTFETPIAVGYKSLVLRVDGQTGEVLDRASPSDPVLAPGTFQPTAADYDLGQVLSDHLTRHFGATFHRVDIERIEAVYESGRDSWLLRVHSRANRKASGLSILPSEREAIGRKVQEDRPVLAENNAQALQQFLTGPLPFEYR